MKARVPQTVIKPDYRQFRLRKLNTPEFSHIKLLLFWPVFGLAFLALERFLKLRCAPLLGIRGLDSSRPYFIQFTMQADRETFFRVLAEEAEKPLDPMELVYPKELPLFEKYDEYLPAELVKKGFAHGVLGITEMKERIRLWTQRI